MNRQATIVTLTLLVISIGSAAFAQTASDDELLSNFNVKAGNSAAYLPVPFHYQSNNYYCGPAALEMVFDYYGEDIPQTEIADVARTYPYVTYTDELRRAAHFSNLSTSLGDEMSGNITGYSAREVGYAAYERWGLTTDDLKTLINKGEPIIVLMWWTPSKVYGHYRVVIGYNETHIIMHDPWNKHVWGGSYGGANTSMAYSTFLELWEYIDCWGLWVHPWKVELQTPITASEGYDFEVMANITYPCSPPFDTGEYATSSCKAAIELQEGLELAPGETIQHFLGDIIPGNSVQTSWSVHSMEIGLHNISVTVTGIVEGNVGTHETYPFYNYMDKIGGLCVDSLLVSNQTYAVHNLDTDLDYATIQEAIDAPETLDGHRILLDLDVFFEHVVVNKSVILFGMLWIEHPEVRTTIDGNGTGTVVSIEADNVEMHSIKVANGNKGIIIGEANNCSLEWLIAANNAHTGIYLNNSKYCILQHNCVKNNSILGIYLEYSSNNNTILENTITNNGDGIGFLSSYNNTVLTNNITKNSNGISFCKSSHNIVSENNIDANSKSGIELDYSFNNTITANNITSNGYGIKFFSYSKTNKVYQNDFINNTQHFYIYEFSTPPISNFLDNGYPFGNYWDNYIDIDEYSGPYQNETGSDGVWDHPYIINENNVDHYPIVPGFPSLIILPLFMMAPLLTVIAYTWTKARM